MINASPGAGYVTSPDAFHLNEGIAGLVGDIAAEGWLSVVVTSQRCVGKGLIDLAGLDAIHAKMQTDLPKPFDAIYAFTGLPGTADWEKPQPGMVEQACRDHDIDPAASVLIGDRDRDIEMARRAGVGTAVRLLAEEGYPTDVPADHTVRSTDALRALVSKLLSQP